MASADGRTVRFTDGTSLDAGVVIWATGYRPDYSWIDIPGVARDGKVIHRRGVTEVPGLYFLGLSWQHTRGSALLGFVRDDAAYLAGLITSHARATGGRVRPAPSRAEPPAHPLTEATARLGTPLRPAAAGGRLEAFPAHPHRQGVSHMPNADAHGAAATNGGQQPPKPVTIAFVLYPGFTALDIIGPFEVLAFVPGHEAVFVAAEPGPVTDDTGRCQLIASASLDQMTAPDVVVIGGTLFTKEPDHGSGAVAAPGPPRHHLDNQRLHRGYLPGRRGILDGKDATTHWACAGELERRGARYTEQRVVERGKVITAAGVSAGIDMALTLLARMHGPQIAQGVQLAIEYDP